jgi:Acyclic terpene utilisation family protein AtuA
MAEKIVRIGCASGFWGDSMTAAPQLVERGEIDYLVFDYLAEVTMSIMARLRAADPTQGYASDFVTVTMQRLMKDLVRKRIKVVSNAGGVNPAACGDAIRALAAQAGIPLKVAVVTGDDLIGRLAELGGAIRPQDAGQPRPKKFMSANAYLGARPIAAALAQGADVVVTGRCVDSALALGPLLHEFGWSAGDYDRLAAGSLAGHIIECGAQATGGLHTDWRDVPDWDDIGYPIVGVRADGSFVVSKPDGTGGLINRGTVAEQMLYEIGDPAAYLLPDVTCDFTAVTIEETGQNRVRVAGARGRAPGPDYKVSATYFDGYRSAAQLTIGGIDATAKAQRTAEALLKRTRRMFTQMNLGDYRDANIEVLGAEATYGPHARPGARATREAIMRLAVSHDDKAALEIFGREVASAATSFAPGTTGYFGGRPKPQPVIRLYSCFVPKAAVPVAVAIDGQPRGINEPAVIGPPLTANGAAPASQPPAPPPGPTVTVPLVRLAFGRSGDKGDDNNIAVIARQPEYLGPIRQQLTADAVARYMAHLVKGEVERFDVPGIHALNFLLHESLGGGGIASLRNDPQGKSHAQMLLDFPIQVPAAWGLTR